MPFTTGDETTDAFKSRLENQFREPIPEICSPGTFQYQILYETRFSQRGRTTQGSI